MKIFIFQSQKFYSRLTVSCIVVYTHPQKLLCFYLFPVEGAVSVIIGSYTGRTVHHGDSALNRKQVESEEFLRKTKIHETVKRE